jgi:hypothetical protein
MYVISLVLALTDTKGRELKRIYSQIKENGIWRELQIILSRV